MKPSEIIAHAQRPSKWEELCADIVAAFASRAAALKPTRLLSPTTRVRNKRRHAGQAVALLSDMQVGSRVKLEDTLGLTTYSFPLFQQRAKRWTSAIRTLTLDMSPSYDLRRLNIFALGDYVEGEIIYPGQQAEIDLPLIDQICRGAAIMASAINELSAHFAELVIYGVIGNHGRLSVKQRPMTRLSNADYLFLLFLQHLLAHNPRVRIIISQSARMGLQLYDWNYLIGHGDDIRSYTTIPFYGAERDSLKLVAMTNVNWHVQAYAHHHRMASWDLSGMEILFNGAWPGGTDLSANRMKMVNPPAQKWFLVHPEKGITYRVDIQLAEKATLRPDRDGIYTPVRGDAGTLGPLDPRTMGPKSKTCSPEVEGRNPVGGE